MTEEINYKTYLNTYEDIPKIGNYILLGDRGIWEITYVDKKNFICCGGLKTDLKSGVDKCLIIPLELINKLKEIENQFKVGDYVKGYNSLNKLKKGIITNIYWTSIEDPFCIKQDNGYTTFLKREGIELTERKHSFFEWIKIYNK